MTSSGVSMIKKKIYCNIIIMNSKIDYSDIRTFRFFFFKYSIVGTQCYSSIGIPYQTIIITIVTMMVTDDVYWGMNQ